MGKYQVTSVYILVTILQTVPSDDVCAGSVDRRGCPAPAGCRFL
jgi:hypothetical protein